MVICARDEIHGGPIDSRLETVPRAPNDKTLKVLLAAKLSDVALRSALSDEPCGGRGTPALQGRSVAAGAVGQLADSALKSIGFQN